MLQDTPMAKAIKAMAAIIRGNRAARMAVAETKNVMLPYIFSIGYEPGIDIKRIHLSLGVYRLTAINRVNELRRMGYASGTVTGYQLTDKGKTAYDAMMVEFGPALDGFLRALVLSMEKYRKEIEQRRPEKGEIVLLNDGCRPDELSRQCKRKRRAANKSKLRILY